MWFGTFKLTGWWKWLPLYLSPVFTDNNKRLRSSIGVAVGSFGRAAYVMRSQ
ncbi:hypothetical protein RGQ21_67640 [Kitasatospora aureofaciens]|nr:hypothetical protein RGQ21_67640 [Kitasatospora aureofaciens]